MVSIRLKYIVNNLTLTQIWSQNKVATKACCSENPTISVLKFKKINKMIVLLLMVIIITMMMIIIIMLIIIIIIIIIISETMKYWVDVSSHGERDPL